MANYNKSAQSQISSTRGDKLIYYDLTTSNFDSVNNENLVQLAYTEKRSTPILPVSSNYKMSILRFSLTSTTLPIWLFQTKAFSTDPLEGVYSITMEWVTPGLTITADPIHLIFVPQDKTKPVPPAPSTYPNGVQPGVNEFYYVYNYGNIVDMVNTALFYAHESLSDIVAAIVGSSAPVMVWNDDLTATIYSELDFYDVSAPNHINIYFNRPLYTLFSSFPSYKFLPTDTGCHFQILTNSRNSISTTVIPAYGPAELIKTDMEYSCAELFSPIAALVFTSPTLPIVPSLESEPSILINGIEQLGLSSTLNLTQPIISDFRSDHFYRPQIEYLPSAEYRYISLLGGVDTPLYEFSVLGWWKDKEGRLHKIYLGPSSTFTMKVLFEKIN